MIILTLRVPAGSGARRLFLTRDDVLTTAARAVFLAIETTVTTGRVRTIDE